MPVLTMERPATAVISQTFRIAIIDEKITDIAKRLKFDLVNATPEGRYGEVHGHALGRAFISSAGVPYFLRGYTVAPSPLNNSTEVFIDEADPAVMQEHLGVILQDLGSPRLKLI